MINSADITAKIIQSPSCCRIDGSLCPCMKKAQHRLLNALSPNKIHQYENGDLLIKSACGKADAIVELSFPHIDEVAKVFNMEHIELLKQSKLSIQQAVERTYGWIKDPYIIATNTHRNSSKKTLEITFQRWIKQINIETFLDL